MPATFNGRDFLWWFTICERATEPFEHRGATICDSAADLARRSDVTLTALLMFSDDSAPIKKVRGYPNLLREERSVPKGPDADNLVDFSMLSVGR